MRCAPVLLLLCLFCCTCVHEEQTGVRPLRCAVSPAGRETAGGRALLCGYNYELLRKFAAESGAEVSVRLAAPGENLTDSIAAGSLDIAALPYSAEAGSDSTLLRMPADSCGFWVIAASADTPASKAQDWLRNLHTRPEHAAFRQPYLDVYNPWSRVIADFISPYDSLLRVYADTLGWDWHLLAALVYSESGFRIEAVSPRGATGLMQLMPSTAEAFGCRDLTDPEDNIRAGVKMLQAVQARFRRTAADREELVNFTLAAYNAGASRISDCVRYAREAGKDASHWENVASIIPETDFDGRETVAYVRRVQSCCRRYRRICP